MATRFRQAPIPYRPGYRGPIDPSFRYGQAPQFFGRVLANQTGIGSIPFVGDKMQNLMGRGFTRLGQFGQRLPGGKRVGNALNFLLGNANRVMDFQEKVGDLTNPLALARQFTGRQGQGRGRGRGGPLGFGLLRRRGQGTGRGGILGLGLFSGGRGATGFSQMSPMQRFQRQQYLETAGPISPGGGLDSYGFGQGIQRPDAAGIAAGVHRQVIESLPFEQRNISSPDGQNYYQLIDKATGKVFMQGQQHPDFKPSGPRMQRIGGGM